MSLSGDRHRVPNRSVRLPAGLDARVTAYLEADGGKFQPLVVEAVTALLDQRGVPLPAPPEEVTVVTPRRVFAMPGPAREPGIRCPARVPAGAWCKSCERIH